MSLWLLSGLIRTRSTAEALERLQEGYVSEEYVALNDVCEWDPYSRSSLAQARELVTIVGGSPHLRNDGCADPNVALDFFSTLKSSPRALIEEESPHLRNDGCADPNVALDFFSTLKSSPRALIEEEVRGDASIGKCSVPLKTFFWPMTALSYDGVDPGVPAPALVGKSLFSTMTLHLALPRHTLLGFLKKLVASSLSPKASILRSRRRKLFSNMRRYW
ncbi:hypothetical protein ARMSODRAFT_1018778 [Armillaria solidipes]|uniref:Uncharacterized protein n=1 Tax=Armillaria solidipes TaxID=1076256 RepID=A0A2H3BZM8_9AGAR|nr:hypothetical protein ARMSODRAFT_1018778 [Armillaria solidipes]